MYFDKAKSDFLKKNAFYAINEITSFSLIQDYSEIEFFIHY